MPTFLFRSEQFDLGVSAPDEFSDNLRRLWKCWMPKLWTRVLPLVICLIRLLWLEGSSHIRPIIAYRPCHHHYVVTDSAERRWPFLQAVIQIILQKKKKDQGSIRQQLKKLTLLISAQQDKVDWYLA